MKCPKCGINYDDSDRECPMCGAPKPLFAKDKSQLAKTTARPASSDNKNTDPMGSILDLGSNKKSSWSKPKKDGKNIIIPVVIIILISVLPALISNITPMISNVTENIVQVEPEPDISIDLTNSYTLDNDKIQFDIFSDGTYCVYGDSFEELGDIITYQYYADEVPELETFLLDNGINLEDCFWIDSSGVFLRFANRLGTTEEWKDYLISENSSGHPVQVLYYIATPVTLQLTPQEIRALSGINTLYADAGDVTVSGYSDPTAIINSLADRIAALEQNAIGG